MKAIVALGALLLACQAQAHARANATVEYRAEPQTQRAAAPTPKRVQVKRMDEPAMFVRLPAPTGAELGSLKDSAKDGRAARIGFARTLPGLAGDDLPVRLQWQESKDGARVAHLAIASRDAAAIRVGIVAKALPLKALLRFHDGSGHGAVEVTGEDVLETIADNLEARQDGASGRTWWSPVIESSTAMIEIELPPGSRPGDVRLGVPRISHLVSSAKTGFAPRKAETACAVDAKCHENMWSKEMNAEARIVFTRDGATYACSGTLLADQDPASDIPYLHTAGHCISSQAEASTLATYWFYRSGGCNSGVAGRYEVSNAGATLLFAHDETDTALLRLNAPPPQGAVYLGWSAGPPLEAGAAVTGISTGGIEMQKISFGDVKGHASCLRGGGMCRAAPVASSAFYYVAWRAGTTMGGGSGSPLVADNSRVLVGHLSSGTSSCEAGSGDFYGRFDLAYHAGMSRWLGASPVAVVVLPDPPPPNPRVDAGPRLRLSTTLSSVPRYSMR